jgi:flagellar biosynthetic protein FlhB
MANHDKTENATGKRKEEARKKGQVAKSTDMNSVVVLVAGLIAVMFMGPKVISAASGTMRSAFALIAKPHEISTAPGLHVLLELMVHAMESTVAPIAAICLAGGVLANVAQSGFHPRGNAMKPDFKRLNPVTGAKRVFGKEAAFMFLKVMAKVIVVVGVAAMTLIPQLTTLTANVGTTPAALGHLLTSNATAIVERVVIVYFLIALVDVIHGRRKHSKELKMTKHEVKEEGKSTQSPPEVRMAIRRRQFQAARARMMSAIPTADVVVTNPTHYAVALRYDGTHPAPIVVAKGKNLVAASIRRIATENNIPIVPDPPLARSLHAMVEIDQMIPAELFAAVALVLAFVYKTAGRRRIAA